MATRGGGTRASANTSGANPNRQRVPVKLRIVGSAPMKKLVLLPNRLPSEPAPPKKSVPPFDLMSRRHPLSSTRPAGFNSLREANLPDGSCDVAGIDLPAIFRRRDYFFFLDVFFAVFFTALFAFAFFAFLAFLAMLPS
jgi:hypothetical protein